MKMTLQVMMSTVMLYWDVLKGGGGGGREVYAFSTEESMH